MTSAKAFNKKNLNLQDFLNECIVSASIYWKMLYTDLVESQEDRYFFAKMEMGLILIFCIVNLIVIILSTL